MHMWSHMSSFAKQKQAPLGASLLQLQAVDEDMGWSQMVEGLAHLWCHQWQYSFVVVLVRKWCDVLRVWWWWSWRGDCVSCCHWPRGLYSRLEEQM